MRYNDLMSNLTQMHSISNENLDQAPIATIDNSGEDEYEGGSDELMETSPEDTTDTVLQEQQEDDVVDEENYVATESIMMLIDKSMRQSFALEELSEQLEDTLADDGEGINPIQAQMITTGSELMDESGSQVAVENFFMDQRIATESLIDTVLEKAGQLKDNVVSAIKMMTRSASNLLRDFIEKIQSSHIRLISYAKKSNALDGFSGRSIGDEKILNRLRAHMPMDGNGNIEILKNIKNGILDITKSITSLITASHRVLSINPTTPEDKALRSIADFYKEVERLNNNRIKSLNVEISVPESFDIEHILSMPSFRVKASVDQVIGSGTQTYNIVSKDEITDLADYVSLMKTEVNALYRQYGLQNMPKDPVITLRKIIATHGAEDNVKQMRELAFHVYQIVVSMFARLIGDITKICGRVARHTVLLVAASFEAAGAMVDPSDTSSDVSA